MTSVLVLFCTHQVTRKLAVKPILLISFTLFVLIATGCGGGGTGSSDSPTISDQDQDGFVITEDCNDLDESIFPGQTEIANNGIDEDCNGSDLIDATLLDVDEDGYTPATGDCNDNSAAIFPGQTEIANNGIDEDCNGSDLIDTTLLDLDGDGFSAAEGDCNENDVSINPGVLEVVGNLIDENCDGLVGTNTSFSDVDRDGFTVEAGDCDDSNSLAFPGATSIPNNGVDEDCDGFDPIEQPDLSVRFNSPDSQITVGNRYLAVAGQVSDPHATLTINGIGVEPMMNGTFTATVTLDEGYNTVIARLAEGPTQVTDTLAVSLDLTPPHLTLESHKDGQVVYEKVISLTGLVNDLVKGTVSEGKASVRANGIEGVIRNRSYIISNYELLEGNNEITLVAMDEVGNEEILTINLQYVPPSGGSIEKLAGLFQSGYIGEELDDGLEVGVTNADGTPLAETEVSFRVTAGDGELIDGFETVRALVARTDANGKAEVRYRLGTTAGSGNHQVTAKTVGIDGEAVFRLSALAKPGTKISVNSGHNQRGAVLQPLPLPLIVVVTDEGHNLVPDSQVQFVVEEGGGIFADGSNRYTTMTNADGRASVKYILGAVTGLDRQKVTAYLLDGEGTTTRKVSFFSTAFVAGEVGKTSISGTVVNNQDQPLPGVTVRAEGSTRQAVTDEQGQFLITEAPVGPVHLIADGSTTTIAGEYPTLSYNIVTVPGVNNPLATPIYMVKVNTENAVYAGKEDVVLTLDELPGFKLEIEKDSITFPTGEREGYVSVTPVNANKIPMLPPNGSQPQLIVTIQPTGAMFDPPAPLTVPNTDGHKIGAQVEMYSYDHDLEEFVSIGFGTVSDDGSVIESNTGVGVVKAGWHAPLPPADSGDTASCGNHCDAIPAPAKKPNPDDCAGNPIDFTTGNKYQSETDFIGIGPLPIAMERYYNSADGKWRDPFSYSLVRYNAHSEQTGIISDVIKVISSSGTDYRFIASESCPNSTEVCNSPDQPWKSNINPLVTLVEAEVRDGSGYRLEFPDGEFQLFNESGQIIKIGNVDGYTQSFSHSGSITIIEDGLGNSAQVTRDELGDVTKFEIDDLLFTYQWSDSPKVITSVTYPDQSQKIYHYEDERFPTALTGITDENGNRFATYQYDNRGRGILTEHANGTDSYRVIYNADETVTVRNPLGKETTYNFIEVAGQKRIKNVEGHSSAYCLAANQMYTYFDDGTLASHTDWNGSTTRYEYNDRGLKTKMVEASGTQAERTTEWTWQESKALIESVTLANGLVISYEYDASGRVTSLNRGGRQTTYDYSEQGLLLSVDGPRTDISDVSTFSYDSNSNLLSQTNAVGLITQFQDYNAFRQPRRLIDHNGIETVLEYNDRGWLTKVTTASQITEILYNLSGQVKELRQPGGQIINFEYDQAQRLVAQEDSLGRRTEYLLDSMGNVTQQQIKDAGGNITYERVSIYDELGRVIEMLGDNGYAKYYGYDKAGNQILSNDGAGNNTSVGFDSLNRLISTTNALNETARLTYDEAGQVKTVSDQRSLTTQYEYNIFGEVIKRISPDSGITTYEYDNASNVIKMTDARSVVTHYQYDAVNRLIASSYPDSPDLNIKYEFDAFSKNDASPAFDNYGKGRLTRVQDETGNSYYRYDFNGNLLEDKHAITIDGLTYSQKIGYEYDDNNRVVQVHYPGDLIVHWKRDQMGQVSGISITPPSESEQSGSALPLISDINYLPHGPINSMVMGNGMELSRNYDKNYRLTSQLLGDEQEAHYQYDGAGNLVEIRDYSGENLNRHYEYDAANRLVTERLFEQSIEYTYDPLGNRTAKITKQGTHVTEEAYQYSDDSNQLMSVGGYSRTYDDNGNTLTDGSHSYTYNARNRLAMVDSGPKYFYHANGQRRITQTADGFIVFHFDQVGRMVSETWLDVSGVLIEQRWHIYMGWTPLAYIVSSDNGVDVYYAFSDQIGMPRVLYDSDKKPAWEFASDAFGVGDSNGIDYRVRMPGQYVNKYGGIYNYTRIYDSAVGRYSQVDSLGLAGGLGLYGYVNNQPVNRVDPYGLCPHCLYIGANALLAGMTEAVKQYQDNGGDVSAIDAKDVLREAAEAAVMSAVGFSPIGKAAVIAGAGPVSRRLSNAVIQSSVGGTVAAMSELLIPRGDFADPCNKEKFKDNVLGGLANGVGGGLLEDQWPLLKLAFDSGKRFFQGN